MSLSKHTDDDCRTQTDADSEDTHTASGATRPASPPSVDGPSEETQSDDFIQTATDTESDARSGGDSSGESGSGGSEGSLPGGMGRRLTARQLARQERLEQGVQQTKWSDLDLPPELDYSTKAKPKTELSEEQQLKRSKEAERRRLQMQKQRKENEESTKARIRAAMSARFRDAISKAEQEESRSGPDAGRPLEDGMVKIRMRLRETQVILPEGAELPAGLQPKRFCGYPRPRHEVKVQLPDSVGAAAHDLRVGCSVNLVADPKTLELWCETANGTRMGTIPGCEAGTIGMGTASVKSLRYRVGSQGKMPLELTLRL
ncbi:unnamed protein product [Ostreobium quekettii]|uniref:INO80 complex subunit B-like conserved region domain-containing protein n=1 Tax=Ostreobium quekettii TaxID=121088 RepID=A0A8S1J333_9CHLO|nr:unnamed protein product [Ostreobium quekettii]|eukprot:evm.model.scf_183.2 EVM.evm.TU.scf_183.2   scf_183:11773-14718(+)